MDYQKLCPNCSNDLTNENDVLLTRESAIFKGHNVYIMCKKCGYVMVYNKDRDLIFSIDKYKDDKEVLKEIEELINEVDYHYTLGDILDEEVYHSCSGMCDSCQGCDNQNTKEELEEMEEIKEVEQEVEETVASAFSPEMLENSFLVVQNETGNAQIIKLEELQFVPDLQNCTVFALEEVMLEPVVSFKIHKK